MTGPDATGQPAVAPTPDQLAALVSAAHAMCVEAQAARSPSWSMAKRWAFDNLRDAVAPFLVADADGVPVPPDGR